MLGELIVKEFAGAHGQPIIIVANLTAKDPQDADKLVYNVIMTALTAATESLPSGLVCFNQKEILAATAPTNPRETLKKTLKTTEKITIELQPTRTMQPTELRMLRTIKSLDEKGGVSEVLKFEYEVIQNAARQHPVTLALTRCVEKSSAPAMITVPSTGSGDVEILVVTLEKFNERGYRVTI
jgi:uncharacterized protein (DUF58 family)